MAENFNREHYINNTWSVIQTSDTEFIVYNKKLCLSCHCKVASEYRRMMLENDLLAFPKAVKAIIDSKNVYKW